MISKTSPGAAAARAFLHLAALTCAGRPRSSRSSTASLFVSQSAAARALVDGVSLGALWSPTVRSELPHLGVRQGCAIRARGRVCRNRLGRSGLGDGTGRVGSLRVGRVA
jgi:hypothetical protein